MVPTSKALNLAIGITVWSLEFRTHARSITMANDYGWAFSQRTSFHYSVYRPPWQLAISFYSVILEKHDR